MAKKKEISWILSAKDKISNVLKRTGAKLKSFAKRGMAVAGKFAAGFAAMGAVVVAVSSKMIAAYHKQATAEAKLASALKATGYAAGFTASELKEQASALQKSTAIGDELILSMQGVLASFRNISGDEFIDATKAILDMSTVLQRAGNDSSQIEQKAIQVGKALNSPIEGITMLTRVGITFTDAQKEQIRTLQESGDMIGAQRIVLDELNNSFGGAAEGINKNVFAYKNFQNSLGDTYEEIGKVITEGSGMSEHFNNFADMLDDLAASGKITLWAEKLSDAMKGLNQLFKPLIATVSWLYKTGRTGIEGIGTFAGNIMETGSFSKAFHAALDVTGDAGKRDTERLKEIRAEKEEQKRITAEKEKQEMLEAQIARRESDKKEAAEKELAQEKAKTKQVTDVLSGMEHKIKLQKLLNKGLNEEAELLKIQKQLGRELSEQEKQSLTNKIKELNAVKQGEEIKTAGIDKRISQTNQKTSLERIGAIFGGVQSSDKTIKIQTQIAKTSRQSLEVQREILRKSGDVHLVNV